MESFYGGRQGASFVIKNHFKFITDAKRADGSYIDEAFGQAWDEYLDWDNLTFKPKKENGEVYTSAEEWKNAILENTMSIKFNDYTYKEVWYGEHCIIDPFNKNNRNTGKIYRRTLKGAGERDITGNVAEYVGQIVGPAGPTPHLRDIGGVDAVQKHFDEWDASQLDDTVFEFLNEEDPSVVDRSKNNGDQLYLKRFAAVGYKGTDGNEGIKLIPGKAHRSEPLAKHLNKYYTKITMAPHTDLSIFNDEKYYVIEDGEYVLTKDKTPRSGVIYYTASEEEVDYIQNGGYNWYNMRINTSTDDISEIYLGFDFPYYVTEIEAGEVLPDVSPIETVRTINQVPTTENPEKAFSVAPFYEKYKLNIPRGLRGAWFENIHSVERTSAGTYYTINAVIYKEPEYKNKNEVSSKVINSTIPTMDTTYPTQNNIKHYDEDGFFLNTNNIVSTTDWPIGAKGWVATFCWRTKNKQNLVNNENSVTHKVENVFLGLNRYIENITFDDDGTLVFKYSAWTTDNEQDAYTERSSQPGDTSTGNEASKYQSWFKKVDWIKQINTQNTYFDIGESNETLKDDDAKVISEAIYNSLPNDKKTEIAKTKTPKNLDITFNNKTVSFEGNNNKTLDTYSKYLNLIAGVKMFQDGSVRFYHTGDTITGTDHSETEDFDRLINWIKQILFVQEPNNENNDIYSDTLKIIMNNDNINSGTILKNLRLITNISLDDEGKLLIQQSDGTTRVSGGTNPNLNLGSYLSWIEQIYRTRSEDSAYYYNTQNGEELGPYHLLIKFNNSVSKNSKNPGALSNLKRVRFRNSNDWYDLGIVQETIDGIEFTTDNLEFEYLVGETSTPDLDLYDNNLAWKYAVYQLNNNPDFKNGKNGKAVVGTIYTRKRIPGTNTYELQKEETVIFYYVNSDEYKGWKILNSSTIQDENNSTIIINGTGQSGAESSVQVLTGFTVENNELSVTWRP